MKKILTMIACLFAIMAVSAKEKAPEVTEVGVYGEGIGNAGRPLLVVTCAAKKSEKVTDLDLKNAALRCVLFRGWTDQGSGFDSSTDHPALCGNPDVEVQHADYFADFLSSGEASNYVSIIPDTKKVLKKGKVYEVSQTVTVDVKALRKKLMRDKIIKGLKRDF